MTKDGSLSPVRQKGEYRSKALLTLVNAAAKGNYKAEKKVVTILGFTINGAKQLGIDRCKGSIEAGKDADFLVFDNDLLTAEPVGFSYNMPTDVYFGGKKVN